MGKLDGKVVIVTGASRGIGAEIARLFAEEGGKVAVVARTLKEGDHVLEGSLEHTVNTIKAAGGEATAITADISDYDQCVRAVEETRAKYGPIDVLVNNAALTYFIPIKDYPISKWHRSIGVNFHAPFYFSQLVLPDMLARKAGSIVNISSGAAIGPGRGPYKGDFGRGGTLYGAEKAALERFTQGLASEVYQDGVSVTCVSPPVVPLPHVHHYWSRMDDPARAPILMAKALVAATLDKVRPVTTPEIPRSSVDKDGKGTGPTQAPATADLSLQRRSQQRPPCSPARASPSGTPIRGASGCACDAVTPRSRKSPTRGWPMGFLHSRNPSERVRDDALRRRYHHGRAKVATRVWPGVLRSRNNYRGASG